MNYTSQCCVCVNTISVLLVQVFISFRFCAMFNVSWFKCVVQFLMSCSVFSLFPCSVLWLSFYFVAVNPWLVPSLYFAHLSLRFANCCFSVCLFALELLVFVLLHLYCTKVFNKNVVFYLAARDSHTTYEYSGSVMGS